MAEGPDVALPPHAELRRIMRGFERSQLIYVAVKLGLVDLVGNDSKDAQTLARATGIDAHVLYRLMRGLAWCGLVRHADDDSFSLTPLGRCLRIGAADSLRDHVLCIGEIEVPAWSALLHAVQAGGIAFEHAFGGRFYDYLDRHADAGACFDRLMAVSTAPVAQAVVRAYDFASVETLVDVGGGNGTLLTTILRAHPHIHGVIFDLPSVIDRTTKSLQTSEIAARLRLVGGDFFVDVPPSADTYILRWVLHNWDDDHCVRLLDNCRRAMRSPGRLLVVEEIMPARVDASTETVSLDLGMMVHLGGGERTEDEFRRLLWRGGFEVTRIIPTEVGVHILDSRPRTGPEP